VAASVQGKSSRLAEFRVAKTDTHLTFIAAQLQQGAGAQKTDGKNNKGEPQICPLFQYCALESKMHIAYFM
jgi:hypothetical protein